MPVKMIPWIMYQVTQEINTMDIYAPQLYNTYENNACSLLSRIALSDYFLKGNDPVVLSSHSRSILVASVAVIDLAAKVSLFAPEPTSYASAWHKSIFEKETIVIPLTSVNGC